MRKNIRRSVAIAAAVSGIWALGAATASADTLPVAPDAGNTGAVTDTLEGVKDTAKGATRGVTEKLPTKSIPENSLPTDGVTDGLTEGELPTGKLPVDADGVTGAADGVKDTAKDKVGGTAEGVVGDTAGGRAAGVTDAAELTGATKTTEAAKLSQVREVVQGLHGLQGVTGGLPTTSLPAQPAQASDVTGTATSASTEVPSAGDLFNGIADAGVRPGAPAHSVLPSAGQDAAGKAIPVAEQAVSDADRTAGNATATTTPYAEGIAAEADALGHGAAIDVAGFGETVAASSVPFAGSLGTGAAGDVRHLAGNAVSGLQQAGGDRVGTVAGAGDLSDAANIPSLPFASTLPATAPAL